PLGDEVPGGSPPVAGQHDPEITGRGHDRSAVRQVPNGLAHRAPLLAAFLLKGPDDFLGVLLERLVHVVEDRADIVGLAGLASATGARRLAAGFLACHATTPVRPTLSSSACSTDRARA